MRRRLLLTAVVIVTLVAILGIVVWRPIYLFTETLRVGEVEEEDGEHIIRIYNDDGDDIAHIALITGMITLPSQNMTSIRLSIWHQPETHLDSLQISFTPSIIHHPFHVYLETPPGGEWKPIKTDSSGNTHVYSFPDLGTYGTGTVTLDFLIQRWSDLPNITITTQITLHDTTSPIVFTRQKATATLTI